MKLPEPTFNYEPEWFVAHTRPRAEKKLAFYCHREGFNHELPTVRTVRKYRGKTCAFDNPLFPGYLFLRISPVLKQKIYQSDYCARIIHVPFQSEFDAQLRNILLAVQLADPNEILLAPQIIAGSRVRIKYGPLAGIEGIVTRRDGIALVHLTLDFIGKAATLRLDASQLEPT